MANPEDPKKPGAKAAEPAPENAPEKNTVTTGDGRELDQEELLRALLDDASEAQPHVSQRGRFARLAKSDQQITATREAYAKRGEVESIKVFIYTSP